MASCGDDSAIMLWDPHSGDHLQTLRRDRPYERMDITGLTGITVTINLEPSIPKLANSQFN